MTTSGIKPDPSCEEAFCSMKKDKKYRYVIYKMNKQEDPTLIIVDKYGERDETYDDFKSYLLESPKECRHAVFDLDFEFKGQQKNKLIFIAWANDNAVIKQKMLYASTKDSLKKKLQMTLEAQCNDTDDLAIENIIEKAQRGMKD